MICQLTVWFQAESVFVTTASFRHFISFFCQKRNEVLCTLVCCHLLSMLATTLCLPCRPIRSLFTFGRSRSRAAAAVTSSNITQSSCTTVASLHDLVRYDSAMICFLLLYSHVHCVRLDSVMPTNPNRIPYTWSSLDSWSTRKISLENIISQRSY